MTTLRLQPKSDGGAGVPANTARFNHDHFDIYRHPFRAQDDRRGGRPRGASGPAMAQQDRAMCHTLTISIGYKPVVDGVS